MATKIYNVRNRSAGRVCYSIPEDRIRRVFSAGETKRISEDELIKLTWQPGGREMLVSFLQITDPTALKHLNIHAQPEYFLNEAQIKDLLLMGTQEQFLDCLDFAPVGVIDLIKKIAVDLPLGDYQKKLALKQKTGFDVDKVITNVTSETESENNSSEASTTLPSGRRTVPTYNVTSRQ